MELSDVRVGVRALRWRSGNGPAVVTGACWLVSAAGMLLVALLGPSAAVPRVPGGGWPPWSLGAAPAPGVVYALELVTALAGVVATWRLLATSARIRPRLLMGAGFVLAAVLTALPPVGSADLLSYLAYGQEGRAGVDPYALGPQSHGVPQDAITQAVSHDWRHTPTVYGPVFTRVSTGIAHLADGDGHVAATLTRLLFAAAFVLTGAVLAAVARTEEGRRRAAVLWSANPLLLLGLVAGAHVDVLMVAPLVCALALVRRFPLAAGLLAGLACTVKITGLAVLPGLLWAARARPRAAAALLAGTAAVALPWYAVTDGAFTQLRRVARFAGPSTPWHEVAAALEPELGHETARSAVAALAAVLGMLLIGLLLRRGWPPAGGAPAGRAAAVTAAFAVGWLFTAQYVLPWYDALAWAPLALAAASVLDRLLLVHTAVLTLALLPGSDVRLPAAAGRLDQLLHEELSPLLLAALVVVCAGLALAGRLPRPTWDTGRDERRHSRPAP